MARIEELLMEDQNVKRKRERCKKQSSLVSELTRKLNTLDSRASTASDYDGAGIFIPRPSTSIFHIYACVLVSNDYTFSSI